jgi:superfamily II DNA or RNA helicase
MRQTSVFAFTKKNTNTNSKSVGNKKIISRNSSNTVSSSKKTDKTPSYILPDDLKQQICSQSYLGKKGYTIPKSIITKEEEEFLRKDLFVKPESFGGTFSPFAALQETAFPVYRESASKFYIPRFYGIARYGHPPTTEIEPGESISVDFVKELRDYQENIIQIYTQYVQQPIVSGVSDTPTFNGSGAILEVPCGRGKCLGINTPILMYDGTIKRVQDVVVGDVLMGDDSTPRNVLSLARGREMMYKVESPKGDAYIVNQSHILSLKYGADTNYNIVDISVSDYLKLPKEYHGENSPLYGYRVPVIFEEKEVDEDPYVFGFSLGKGSNSIGNRGHTIPHRYKCNTRNKQLALLAGIIDSIGKLYNNQYEISHKKRLLIDDIVYVSRSLGLSADIQPHNPGEEYRVIIYGSELEEIPVKDESKKVQIEHSSDTDQFSLKTSYNSDFYYSNEKGVSPIPIKKFNGIKYRIKVNPIGVDNYYGFEIDGNHRFILGDYTVTHNTVMGLKIISILKKKTLIIVHKEFLMNQWIERIAEFLPNAKVGKIQGQTFDIYEKDIVIGMIQTLYDKDFPANTFSSFGLTIVDEVHRIGSEQFSKTLFKTITPYMLGISATVERKDKLTKVLYMFIGEKIYSESREDVDPVCVRAIEYKTSDKEFNEVEVDFKGQPQYSKMIVKLCDYTPRSEFIVNVIRDLVEEHPDNQIMILAHNRSLLTYLYNTIQGRNLATVGYYLGGMKQKDLQETETRQIVIATYAMAAEALDIKTLSTLVMVTPKTDIIQSVGRILRVKHEHPIIVDIVDQHDLFQNQWRQRMRYYKKCNYRIQKIDSPNYRGMNLEWDTDTTWKRIYEPPKNAGSPSSSTGCSMQKNDNEEGMDSEAEETGMVSSSSAKIGKCLIDLSLL